MALSIQKDGLMYHIIHAENRDETRCPDYDEEDIYWQAVDELLLEQKDVTAQIKSFASSTTNPEPVVVVSETLVKMNLRKRMMEWMVQLKMIQ